ncbi:MAG TPA: flavodoxin-dependent (E)-4-hydroxy-3-methylbut-2-enyl-diphosphate synthase, partial [Spirochaetia bacterium]|nr:flavodoxin-dependent (E)-4-hydroxy-3-methylbut-2-enyl-diphosphate synthase [Spirochaetia bacterium]
MNSKVYKSPRPVKAGNLMIGGGFPLSVQTMWKEPLHEVSDALVDRIDTLVSMGLDILRFAVPDMETVSALKALAPRVKIPLVADIHFDYKLALASIAAGVSKVRINPGNIGAPWKVEEVVRAARDSDVAIRVGINAGSLPVVLRKENDRAKALISAAEAELDILERLGFHAVVFSLKSSDIESTIAANERFASLYDYPLHLGVTEAGPLIGGVVKSTVALSRLLQE